MPLWNADTCAFSPQSQSGERETEKVSSDESRDGERHWATQTKQSFPWLGATLVSDAELGVLVPIPVDVANQMELETGRVDLEPSELEIVDSESGDMGLSELGSKSNSSRGRFF
ncbi:hypothetical protein Salat_0666600 [Sesamum alatum]|uniref:Uncharacterized protein n=1 Tax=Sesamum alatum TaxID=300844 RepID=A0AAE2CUJ5_9LAMI|nr:hypothetical protein Salat_0666600 [Sesamum alatum]